MVQTDKVVKRYIVMMKVYDDTDKSYSAPYSNKFHGSRFEAFLEMERAKDDPRFAGEIFYIKEVSGL